jgi:hypothetical protein
MISTISSKTLRALQHTRFTRGEVLSYLQGLVVVTVPLEKSGREQEVAQSGQKEEGEMEQTVGDEKAHCA